MGNQPSLFPTDSKPDADVVARDPKQRQPRPRITPFDRAFRHAMQRLNRRAMSSAQLAVKLRALKHESNVVSQVIERLTKIGALDDEKLGRALIEENTRRKPAGHALLRAKLVKYDLDEELIERLLSEVAESASPVEEAKQLIAARLPSLSKLTPAARLRRLAGLLARRGFDEETIEAALEGL